MDSQRRVPPDLHALLMTCLNAGLEVVFCSREVTVSHAKVRIWRESHGVDGAGATYAEAIEAAVYNARQAGWIGANDDE